MPPRYRYPFSVSLKIVLAVLFGGRRSIRQDSLALRKGISSLSLTRAPASFPDRNLLVVFNHYSRPGNQAWWSVVALAALSPFVVFNRYSRPGYPAWWSAIALAALSPFDLHFAITSAWTRADPIGALTVTPASELILARLARVYGFTSMPPMPPRPKDTARRAAAVRHILRLARTEHPVIALSPEGMDSPDGRLMEPPPGVGRFAALILESGYQLLAAGIYEEGDKLCVRFGDPLPPPAVLRESPPERDRRYAEFMMHALANQLPERLRGRYG